MRVAQMQDIPYFLGADVNVNPSDSNTVKCAIEIGISYDTFSDAYGGDPPPTYRKGNIIPEMDGDGVSRIDVIFCNAPANHSVVSLNYGIRAAASFDHVLLQMQSNYRKFNDEINTAVHPAKLQGRPYKQLNPTQKLQQDDQDTADFREIWAAVANRFDEYIFNRKLDDAHDIWCLVAEKFLWRMDKSVQDLADELPAGKPRRGKVLPTVKMAIANKINDNIRSARSNFSMHVEAATGLLGDFCSRIRRLQGYGNGKVHCKGQWEKAKNDTIIINFDEKSVNAANSSRRQGCAVTEITGTLREPSEYDIENAGKVLPRVVNPLQRVWTHDAKQEAEKFQCRDGATSTQPVCTAHAADDGKPDGQMPVDWNFLTEGNMMDLTDDNNAKLTINKLQQALREVKAFARTVGASLRGKRNAEVKAKLNGDHQSSEHEFFRYLRSKCDPADGAVYDPINERYVFDINEQHDVMIREWKKVFDKHKEAPPSWQKFIDKYGIYHERNHDCPKGTPSASRLHARAKRARNDTSAGSDGWMPRELKLSPMDDSARKCAEHQPWLPYIPDGCIYHL